MVDVEHEVDGDVDVQDDVEVDVGRVGSRSRPSYLVRHVEFSLDVKFRHGRCRTRS